MSECPIKAYKYEESLEWLDLVQSITWKYCPSKISLIRAIFENTGVVLGMGLVVVMVLK